MRTSLCVAVCIFLLIAQGCTRTSPSGAGQHGSQARTSSTVVFNISEDPHSLDPILAQNDDEHQVARLMFDLLLDVDERGRLIPALATTVPTRVNGGVSADGKKIVYRLRRGVVWQDGAPFTSRDVRFTWKAIVDKRNDVPSTRGYDLITSVDTPDAWTAIVHLRRAWGPAVATLFTYGATPMEILPAHILEGAGPLRTSTFNQHPIGTGPFELTSWTRGEELTFSRNARYFRGVPKAREVVAREVPDINTDLVMLRGGQLDWSLLSPAQRLALGQSSALKIVYAPFAGFGAIAFNCRKPPFDDVRMRRAVAMAIDRKRLSDGITRGQYPVTDSDQPVYSWAHDADAKLPAFNAALADRSFDALGWSRGSDGMRRKNGVPLNLDFVTFPEGDTAVRTAEYVQAMLRERGIAVNVKKVSIAQFYLPRSERGLLLSGTFDMAYIAWRTGADPDDSNIVSCAGVSNYAGYCSARVDALEREALAATDVRERKQTYARIQRLLAREVPYDFLYAPEYGFAVQPAMHGLRPSPFSPTWNAWQWSISD
ncbi:MAG TPA: peptide ABC transporter substrate-binding protein [Candidatus Eremiobacteraceae bacterium]|nr:peptide ABC transporter substrate-binding protein [Candidatus Eremiobacteraceae bacterium]